MAKLTRASAWEFSLYGALVLGGAAGARAYFLPTLPPAPEPVTVRNEADAAVLREYVGWKSGQPMLVEFLDLECPPCRSSWPKIQDFLRSHPGVQSKILHFPLSIHPTAFGAATAVEIARSKGRQKETFEDLFKAGVRHSPASLNGYLQEKRLPGWIGTPQAKPFERAVRRDMDLANQLMVNATPTLFTISRNGRVSQVRSVDALGSLLR